MLVKKHYILISLFLFLLLVVSFSVSVFNLNAQVLPGSDPITLQINPRNPQPNQNVTVQVQSLSMDLNKARISWSVNGTTIASEKGLKSFVIKAGANGSATVVGVSVAGDQGATFSETITIRPVSVDLIWHARSYTPPFYKGKALYPYQGEIVIAALPNIVRNGSIVNPKTLVYTWKNNGEVIGSASGYGKDSITMRGSVIARSVEISVTVTSDQESFSGTARTTITPQTPLVLMYEDSPLYGTIYSRALYKTANLTTSEIKLRAAPYFFSTLSPHSTALLAFNWSVNSQAASFANNSQPTITLRPPQGVSGASNIGIKVNNPSGLLQSAGSNLTMNFKAVQ